MLEKVVIDGGSAAFSALKRLNTTQMKIGDKYIVKSIKKRDNTDTVQCYDLPVILFVTRYTKNPNHPTIVEYKKRKAKERFGL